MIAAVGLVVASLVWDQLFLVYEVLPATIPWAIGLVVAGGWRRRKLRVASRSTAAAPARGRLPTEGLGAPARA